MEGRTLQMLEDLYENNNYEILNVTNSDFKCCKTFNILQI